MENGTWVQNTKTGNIGKVVAAYVGHSKKEKVQVVTITGDDAHWLVKNVTKAAV